jgi:MSHA biogenesis protein MshI
MRQQACTGVHLTPDLVATATVEHDHGRRPRLVSVECHRRSGTEDLARLLRGVAPGGRIPVHLVIDSSQYELLLVEAPRVEPSELRAAVRWKVKSLIDFHIDDAVIDVFEIPGQDNRPQGQRMMYVIAARARNIRELVDMAEEADLNLQVIDVADMALRNLAALLDDDVRGVAMLHLERDHGVITVTRQGNLYLSRRLETGHDSIREIGHEQLLLEIQRSLDYYDSHFAQPPIGSLHVLPGFAGDADLVGNLADGLDLQVAAFDPQSTLDCQVSLPREHLSAALVAIGGALRREEVSL